MTAALASAPHRSHPPRPPHRVVLRPVPPREPPFDDELTAPPATGRYDQRLPFDRPASGPAVRPVPSRPAGLPDPAGWARRLLIGLIETADGRRPLHQLAAMLSPSIASGLGADFERAAVAGTGHWLQRAAVLTVRGDEPAPGVAELCATVEVRDRVRAVAMRLERHHGHWTCTRLQLG